MWAVKLFRRTVILGCAAIIQEPGGGSERRYLFARHRYAHGARGEIWALPGGGLGHEPLAQGLIREVDEELGVRVSVQRLLAVDTSNPDEANFFFACTIVAGDFRPSDEVAEIQYFPATNDDPAVAQGQLAILRRIAERDAGGSGPLFLY
jgi:8-oxo-dGTP pyrophosphatase MutT (NUDIX family)